MTTTERPAARLPHAGDVLRLTHKASVQFTEPILFRVIRIHDWTTYQGWVWLDGYQLNPAWDAVARRSLFVQVAGLVWVHTAPELKPIHEGNTGPRRRAAGVSRLPNRGPG